MPYRRIIPCLDVKGGRVVKGVQFADLRDAGDPTECAELYDRQGADEICFLDITATIEERDTLFALVARTAARIRVPLTVGGGVRALDDVKRLLDHGADKVAVNSAAVRRPDLIDEIARAVGSQCLVLAIDSRQSGPTGRRVPALTGCPDSWVVHVRGGRDPTEKRAVEWAKEVADRGAGEILLTSMDRDGTQLGYDLALTGAVANAVTVPVIASGGAGTIDHLREGLEAGAAAVLAASIFHFGAHTVREVRAALAAQGVPVRPS